MPEHSHNARKSDKLSSKQRVKRPSKAQQRAGSIMANRESRLARKLDNHPALLVFYAMLAGFGTYFCMYAFRKPFSAAEFDGQSFLGSEVGLKTALVISQIIGYTVSKYAGIKVLSEMSHAKRAVALIGLVGAAQVALLLYGVVSGPWKVVAIFLNGLPLGMVWGLVVSYLEGRRTSELLLAGLSCSFIVASGVVKDIGRWVMADYGVSEGWMPVVVGGIFILPFVGFVWMLNQLPEPNAEDVAERVERQPMNAEERWRFVRNFAPGLVALLAVYFFLTAYRDFRDNYGVELFRELGYGDKPAVFSQTELIVAFGVMVAMGLLNLIKDNTWGLIGAFVLMIGGLVLVGIATALLEAERIDGLTWMTLTGLGAYLCYVPYNSVLFDRLIAFTRVQGTAVFAIYLADALGYTGSIGIQLYKDIGQTEASRLGFFTGYSYTLTTFGVVALVLSCLYFVRKGRTATG